MTSQISQSNTTGKSSAAIIVLLTPKEAAKLLKVSLSWLAKARMRGDGPPYIKIRQVDPLQRSRPVAVAAVSPALK